MRRVLAFIPALLLLLAAPVFAQGEQSGAVRGRIASSDGLALPGVTITVESPSLQGVRSAVTDVNGVYSIPGLPPGDYVVRFELSGFAAAQRKVSVPLGSPLVLDRTMTLEVIKETVDVKAPATAPAAAPSGAVNVRTETARLLPIGRTPFHLAELTPGLTDNTPQQNQVTIGGGMSSPVMPPAIPSTRLSVSSCRMSCPRLAPSAARMASSRRRPVARAIRRLETLAQAMSSTSPTAPWINISASRMSPTSVSRIGWMRISRPALVSPCFC